MGCDYYATDEGKFEIQFRTESGEKGIVIFSDLEPHERIWAETTEGQER